jgi:PD-(D/E)XK nuclease superfamily
MMLDTATSLLDDFQKLPGRVERPRTFMEIAGYPHYENVCSNILAFFMDPEESHGFGPLVLDALTSIGNGAETERMIGASVSVDREVVTSKGNKIDLLITSDNHVVLIENKIYAAANDVSLEQVSAILQEIINKLAMYRGAQWTR